MNYFINLIKDYPSQITALTAMSALLVSLLSIFLTFLTLWFQRRHNFKSLTPVASILIGDYENKLEVKIRNSGVGPLIVEQFIAFDGNQERDDIISWMPSPPEGIHWVTFTENVDGWCIAPNKEVVVIRIIGNPADEKFVLFRTDVRRALSNLTVALKYRDIYDRKMPTKQRDLNWFARHFEDLDLTQAEVGSTMDSRR